MDDSLMAGDGELKGIGSFLVRMTNIEEVQLFELLRILGKNGGQIYKANFSCSSTFIKYSFSHFALEVLF